MSAPVIVTIRPGVAFEPAAAMSWRRMEARLGRRIDVNSSYRDYSAQMIAYNAYRAYVAGIGPWAPYALHPDKSMHCKGLAVDTDDQAVLKGFASHGWRQTALQIGEPWHFDYFRSMDDHQGEPAGGGSIPLPIPEPDPEPTTPEDDEMILIEALPDCGRAVIGPGYFRKLNSSEELKSATQMTTKTLTGNARQFDVWKSIALQGTAATSAVVLTDAQLEQIEAAARAGGADAIRDLEFVVSVG